MSFQATTHMVAHLLRELDGALRGVLEPMTDPEAWPEKNTDDRQRKMIDCLCDVLRVPEGDPLRDAWLEFAGPLHTRAHRHGLAAPRPVDVAYRDSWDRAEVVIYDVARRIEATFAATLPFIERLAEGDPNLAALRSRVPHSTVALDRFFDRAGIAWLEPLAKADYFADPPPLVAGDDGSISYPRWPQGRYLVRMALEAPEFVIGLAAGLETDNPEHKNPSSRPPAPLRPQSLRDLSQTPSAGSPQKLRPGGCPSRPETSSST